MMSTKFFTNEHENTLLSKIEGIFQHRNIFFFDALVGYFYASGYFSIRKFVEKASEIRILVGIDVNRLILEANQKGLLFDIDAYRSQEDFFENLKKDIQKAAYSKEVEEGMCQLIADIAARKVKIRVHPRQNIHAKIYIFREKDKHAHGYGSVITGSSNLTKAGLSENFEFNVELRDNADIDFATHTFEKLWDESIPLSNEFIERLTKETYLNHEFTPYEIYLKFLIEYFGKNVDFDPNSLTDLPKGFKKLQYQADAVRDGYAKMQKHGGFFLADVVGLGKTVIAILIARFYYHKNGFPEYRSHTLIISPPALKDNWQETVEAFRLDNCEVVTNGSLHKIRNPDKYDLIIVDEAHKFRSDMSEMYNQLQKICKSPTQRVLPDGTRVHKRVMLVSATPLNNKPEDIANLVYLFQDSKDSTLEIGNLQHFFRGHIDAYKKLHHDRNIPRVTEAVKKMYEQIREKIIKPLTVRRTRTDLTIHVQYVKDLEEQNIRFPKVQKPEKIFYQLEPDLEELYDKTIQILKTPVTGLTYTRYQAIRYLKEYKKHKYKRADMISEQLAKIMKTLLVKRLDSSFHAFTQSIRRFMEATQAMITMLENDRIYIAPDLPVSEYINTGREEELMEMVLLQQINDPSVEICTRDDFNVGFAEGLYQDYALLKELHLEWSTIKEDPKLEMFITYLQDKLFDPAINPQQKLVVFSESKETTDYLTKELTKRIDQKILVVDSKTRKDRMPLIRANFDANIPKADWKDDYDMVLATEVLAEGVNMHRSNIIVNYDTPWNSTRLMQRIGRVNRIGSTAREVHIFNFFPTAKVNSEIELEKKAIMKLQAFHVALGEDSQIYTPDEEISTFGLFDQSPEEIEKDESLAYLMLLRTFKEEHPDRFKEIKKMPLRARVGRKDKFLKEGTIAFIRNAKRDAFFYVKSNEELEELTFVETANKFRCDPKELAIPLHPMHHEQVQKAIQHFAQQLTEEKVQENKADGTQGPNEKKAHACLEGLLNLTFISPEEVELVRKAKEAIRKGKFQNLQRDINKLHKACSQAKDKAAVVLEKMIQLLKSYPLDRQTDNTKSIALIPINLEPEIIISESFYV